MSANLHYWSHNALHECFFSMKVYAKEQGIQDSIANGQYPNYKDTNRQNEKESNNKVKLMKVWI